jgi:hypothetical protein
VTATKASQEMAFMQNAHAATQNRPSLFRSSAPCSEAVRRMHRSPDLPEEQLQILNLDAERSTEL